MFSFTFVAINVGIALGAQKKILLLSDSVANTKLTFICNKLECNFWCLKNTNISEIRDTRYFKSLDRPKRT